MQKPSALILDLDFTIAHLEGGYDAIYSTLATFEIPRYEARTLLRKVADSEAGFTFDSYIQALEAEWLKADWSMVTSALEALFKKSFVLYPDVLGLLEAVKSKDIPIIVITSGNPVFQQMKLDLIPFAFDSTHITTIPKAKGDIIYKIQQQTGANVWLIESKRRELVRIFETPKIKKAMITLFEIDRPDKSHKETTKDDRFVSISQFTPLIEQL